MKADNCGFCVDFLSTVSARMRVYTGIIAAGSKFVQRPYCLDRPIKTDDEIEKVLENAEEKHDHGETVSLWPSGSRPAEFRSASLQLGLEETRDLESDLIRESGASLSSSPSPSDSGAPAFSVDHRRGSRRWT